MLVEKYKTPLIKHVVHVHDSYVYCEMFENIFHVLFRIQQINSLQTVEDEEREIGREGAVGSALSQHAKWFVNTRNGEI